jgi:hypothetical protein
LGTKTGFDFWDFFNQQEKNEKTSTGEKINQMRNLWPYNLANRVSADWFQNEEV